MLQGKKIDSITESDLQFLIDNRISETKTIEYKRILPTNDNDGKKEFLADVSSFANASGGCIIYGIAETAGSPTAICSLTGDPDAEKLRLENLLRTSIAPRIPGLSIVTIPIAEAGFVMIMDIPRSWASPHVVSFQNHWRFYSRNSAGKYPLDVAELKAAFLFSESITSRIQTFRMERLGHIISGDTPVPLIADNGRLVLHLIPVDAFNGNVFDIHSIESGNLSPITSYGWNNRYNFDGRISYSPVAGTSECISYLQVYRNGIIEAVDCRLLINNAERGRYIPGQFYERRLIEALPRLFAIQNGLGVNTPVILMLSLLGVRGFKMAVNAFYYEDGELIDRDNLIIPEVVVEDMREDPGKIMRTTFDFIWNAAGWRGSLNYDANGNWVGMRE